MTKSFLKISFGEDGALVLEKILLILIFLDDDVFSASSKAINSSKNGAKSTKTLAQLTTTIHRPQERTVAIATER